MNTPPDTPEWNRFNDALRQVMTVSKVELNRRIAEEKEANAGKPKRGPKPSSGHASGNGD
jgi:hypothetical protein